MKLTELEPEFVRYETREEEYEVIEGEESTWRERGCPTKKVTGPREYITRVGTLAEAQGLWFLCPRCFERNGGAVGTHKAQVTFHGVPANLGVQGKGHSPRWSHSGASFEDLTISPSIQLIGGCAWHGFIQHGNILSA